MSGHIVWPAYLAGIAVVMGTMLGQMVVGTKLAMMVGAGIGIGVFALAWLLYEKRNSLPRMKGEDSDS